MPGRVLVTGIGGFTGPYLRAALEARGYEVAGVTDKPSRREDNALDLLDAPAVARYLAARPVEYAVHLAGISHVVHGRAADYYEVNVIGSFH